MQKYVIIKLLEPVDDDTQFPMTEWPLHITLAPNFTINKSVPELVDLLNDFCVNHSALDTTVGDDDYFGLEKQVHVAKLERNPELTSLHTDLVVVLKASGAIFDEPQYIEDGYIAHATVWREKRINKGEKVAIDQLTLVDMFPGGDIRERKTLQTIDLR